MTKISFGFLSGFDKCKGCVIRIVVSGGLLLTIASCCLGQSLNTLLAPIRTGVSIPSADPRSIQARAEIQAMTDRIVERWNAHDIEGYMQGAWKSDKFQLVVEEDQTTTTVGWAKVLESYKRGYADRDTMGTARCELLGVQLITPELALVSNRCTQIINGDGRVGRSWALLGKFAEGWRVISDYSTYHPHTPPHLDPYYLRPWKMVPFGSQQPLWDPSSGPDYFFVDLNRNAQRPVILSLSSSSVEKAPLGQ